jgi:hypothetical protein
MAFRASTGISLFRTDSLEILQDVAGFANPDYTRTLPVCRAKLPKAQFR